MAFELIRPEAVTESNLTSSVAQSEAAWNSGATYALAAVARKADADGVVRRWISAQSGNTNHDPVADDGTWWTDDGPTNRWNMFDRAVQTQTENADDITVEIALAATSRADTVALLNVSGTAAQVTVEDPDEGVVYDQTFSLVSDSGITDWFAWFFEPITRKRDLVITGLPPYSGSTVTVAVTEAGATVKVGACEVGFAKRLGDTQYGAEIGIVDYSRKDSDDFGNVIVVERAFSKRLNASVIVPKGAVDDVANILADYRATPALYIGSDDYASTAVWGFVKDWSTVIAYPDRSLLSISIESLT